MGSKELYTPLLSSSVWSSTLASLKGQLSYQQGLRQTDLLQVVNTVLDAGNSCLGRCCVRWSGLSYHVLDASTVDILIIFLTQCLEEKLDNALYPQFFQAIENLILLVSADKQSTDNLNSLAALLSIPFLPPQG